MASPSVEGRAFARAGVLGNPSDAYNGRILAIVLRNFQARVILEESHDLRIEPESTELDVFSSVEGLAESVARQGYYGGSRLIKAMIKVFHDYCRERGDSLGERNFTARFQTSIPRQVGLAGSSAIATATLRALMSFFGVDIPREVQPNLILSAERDELGINAGLMDRVAQVYEGFVYMDLSREVMDEQGFGAYESLDPTLLPRMFVAHRPGPTKVSGRVHQDLRSRWDRGDLEARETLDRIAELAVEGRKALLEGNHGSFSSAMNRNFDLRRRIMNISDGDLAMVEAARGLGASAKLTGSGGAILGVMKDEKMKERLVEKMGFLGARVLEPVIE